MRSTQMEQILRSIEYHRRIYRLSQRELSFCMGWSVNRIQRIESGQADLTVAELVALAEFLGCL